MYFSKSFYTDLYQSYSLLPFPMDFIYLSRGVTLCSCTTSHLAMYSMYIFVNVRTYVYYASSTVAAVHGSVVHSLV